MNWNPTLIAIIAVAALIIIALIAAGVRRSRTVALPPGVGVFGGIMGALLGGIQEPAPTPYAELAIQRQAASTAA